MITQLQVRNLLAADLTYASRIRVVSPPPSTQPITVSIPPFSRTGTMICYTGKAIKLLSPTIPWVKKVVDHVEAQMVDTALVEENQRLRSRLLQVEQDGNAKAARLEARLENALDKEQNLEQEVQRLTGENEALEEEKQAFREEKHELRENLTQAEQKVAHVEAQLVEVQIAHKEEVELKAKAEQKVVALTQEKDGLKAQLDEGMKGREAEQLAAKEANHELCVSLIKHEQKVTHVDARLVEMQIAHKEEIQVLKAGHRQEMKGAMELTAEAEKKVVALTQEKDDLVAQLEDEKKGREDEKLAANGANQELHDNLIKADQQVAHLGAQLAKMEVAHDGAVESKVEAELKVVALTQERDGLTAQLDEERKGREAERLAVKEEIQIIKNEHRQEMGVALDQVHAASREEIQTVKSEHQQEMNVTLGQLHAAWDKATNLEGQLENTQGSLAAAEDQNGFLISENKKLQKRAYALQEKVDAVVEKAIVQATTGTKEENVEKEEQIDDKVQQVILRATGEAKNEQQKEMDAMIEKTILQATRGVRSEEQERMDAMVEKAIFQATTREVKTEKQEPLDFKAMLAKVQGGFEARDRQVKARAVSPLTPPMTPYPQFPNQVIFPPTPQSPFVGRFYSNEVSQKGMDSETKSREACDFVADVPWS